MLSKNVNNYLRSGEKLAQCAMFVFLSSTVMSGHGYLYVQCTKGSSYGHCIFSTILFRYTMGLPQLKGLQWRKPSPDATLSS